MKRHLAALAAVLTVTLGAACGGDEEPSGAPDDPGSSAETSDSGSPGAQPSDPGSSTPSEPSSPPEPTVAPATGPLLKEEVFTINAVDGWIVNPNGTQNTSFQALSPELGVFDTVASNDFQDVTFGALTLEQSARATVETTSGPKPKILPNVVVNGVEMYHLAGRDTETNDREIYGTFHRGRDVRISFTVAVAYPDAKVRAIIDSMLASVVWK